MFMVAIEFRIDRVRSRWKSAAAISISLMAPPLFIRVQKERG